MGRRMTSKDRREQILQGAMRLFAEKGFRGTTTREIAQKLRISEALMFKHFPSKEALYRAIIQQRMNGAKDMLFPKEALKAKDDRQVFSAMASYLIRRNTEDPTFLRLVLYSALEEYDLSKIFFKNNATKNTKILANYIQQRIHEKAFKKVHPLLAARAFIGMVLHYIQSQEIYGMGNLFNFPQKKVVETFVDSFLNGIQNQQERNESKGRKSTQSKE
jgi:AcrR family transcriptional regulator